VSIEDQIKRLQEQTAKLAKAREAYIAALGQEDETVKKYLATLKKLELAEETQASNVEALRLELGLLEGTLSNADKEIVEITQSMRDQQEEVEKLQKRMDAYKKGLDAVNQGLTTLKAGNLGALTSTKGWIESIIDLTFALNQSRVELGRTTGMFRDFQDNLTGLAERNRALAIGFEESAQIINGLSTQMQRFNALGDGQQAILEDIGARFFRLGVDTQAFGQALDTVNYSFGLTGQAAAEAARSLEGLATEIGRPVQTVVSDLNELGPSLARFGQQGIKVFEKLAKQARELGLTTKQAFDISELFDTFESAANVAGRLNAQLGLQLNSVELLKASSEDRIDLLRQEFNLQGIQFESLGRRQRQMIADILGQDEQTAARLLGGKVDIAAFQKEQREKTITDMVSVQERMAKLLEQILTQFSKHVVPVLERILHFINRHFDKFVEWAPLVLGALVALKTASLLKSSGVGGVLTGVAGATGVAGLATAGRAALTALPGPAKAAIGAGIIASGASGAMLMDENSSMARQIVGLGANVIGGLATAAGLTAATGGVGVLGAFGAGVAGGAASEFAALKAYDAIFGKPSAPPTTNAAMNSAARRSRRANMDQTTNVTVNLTSKLDGKVLDQRTINTLDTHLDLTSRN